MKESEKNLLIALFEKWRTGCENAAEKETDSHLQSYYTGHAAGYFEVIHYLRFKHELEE